MKTHQPTASTAGTTHRRGARPFFSGRSRPASASSPCIQTKLSVSQPGDRHEVEAEHMADYVGERLNTPFFSAGSVGVSESAPAVSRLSTEESEADWTGQEPGVQRMAHPWLSDDAETGGAEAPPAAIQRAADDSGDEVERGEEEEERLDPIQTLSRARSRTAPVNRVRGLPPSRLRTHRPPPRLHTFAASRSLIPNVTSSAAARIHPSRARGPPGAGSRFESNLASTKGGGDPLPARSRARMEPAFGADFGDVRVHTSPQAAGLANNVNAHAFTHGRDIYFNHGQYAPDSPGGQRLLAHELTHVVQQGAAVQTRRISRACGSCCGCGNCSRAPPERLDRSPSSRPPALSRAPPSVQRLGWDDIKERVNSYTENIPGFTLATVIAGYNPVLGRNVEWSLRNFFRGAAGLIPGGMLVYNQLEEAGIVDSVFGWIGRKTAQYNLTYARLSGLFDQAWEEMDFLTLSPIDHNVAVVRRVFEPFLRDVSSFVGDAIAQLIRILEELAQKAFRAVIGSDGPAYDLIAMILGKDPLTGDPVAWETAGFLRSILQIFGFDSHLAKLEETGKLQEAADWIDAQVGLLVSAFTGLIGGIKDIWSNLDLEKLVRPDKLLGDTLNVALTFVGKLLAFAGNVASKVLEIIKDVILWLLETHLHGKRGYTLFTVVLGQDPVTQEEVPRTAANFIKGFLEFSDKGTEVYNHLVEGNAIGKAMDWLKAQVQELGLTPAAIAERFLALWESFSIDDLMNPLGAFERVAGTFLGFIGDILTLAGRIGFQLLKILFEVVMGGGRVMAIIEQAGDAFRTIVEDPIGFIGNLIGAVKQGFSQFGANILEHLKTGLMGWLFGALEGAGIQLPQSFDLKGILSLALQVLGLTYRQIRPKLVQHLGEEVVGHLETAFEAVRILVTEGIAGVWERITEFLTVSLPEMVIGAIKGFVIEKIVKSAIVKLASMLNPAGAVVQAIIAIYNTVMFFIERWNQIVSLAESVVNSIAKIANGQIAAAANFVEQSMARTLPVIISFLARLLGLGGISEKIKEIIAKVQEPVGKAVDKVIGWIVKQARKLFRKVLQAGTSDMSPQEKLDRGLELAQSAVNRFRGKKVGEAVLNPLLAGIKTRYGLADLRLVPRGNKWVVTGQVNPKGEKPTDAEVGTTDPEEIRPQVAQAMAQETGAGLTPDQVPGAVAQVRGQVESLGADDVRAQPGSNGNIAVSFRANGDYFPVGDLVRQLGPVPAGRTVRSETKINLVSNHPITNLESILPRDIPAGGKEPTVSTGTGGRVGVEGSEIRILSWNTSPMTQTGGSHAEAQTASVFPSDPNVTSEAARARAEVLRYVESIVIRNFTFSACSGCASALAGMLRTICTAQRNAGEVVLKRAEIFWTTLFSDTERFPRPDRTTWSSIQEMAAAGWTIHAPATALPDTASERHNPVAEAAARRPLSQRIVVIAGTIQCKSAVASGDSLEREADAVADQVVDERAPPLPLTARTISRLPRSGSLQRKAGACVASQRAGPGARGSALPAPVRTRMESRFGTDFGSVRIHTGREAAEQSTRLDARAFTRGNDIYFNRGEYYLSSRNGRHLLAHELTHVVQQRGGQAASGVQCAKKKAPAATPSAPTGPPRDEVVLGDGSRIDRVPQAYPGSPQLRKRIEINGLSLPAFKHRNRRRFPAVVALRPVKRVEQASMHTKVWREAVESDVQERTRKLCPIRDPKTEPDPVFHFWAKKNNSLYLIGKRDAIAAAGIKPFWSRKGQAVTFQIDHVVEDQIVNRDDPSLSEMDTADKARNFELLETTANQASGRALNKQIDQRIKKLIARFEKERQQNEEPLEFKAVRYGGYFVSFYNLNFDLRVSDGPSWSFEEIAAGKQFGPLEPVPARQLHGLAIRGDAPLIFLSPLGGEGARVPPAGQLPKKNWLPRITLNDVEQDPKDAAHPVKAIHVDVYRSSEARDEFITCAYPDMEWPLLPVPGIFGGAVDVGAVRRQFKGAASSLQLRGLSPIDVEELHLSKNGISAMGKVLPTLPFIHGADIDIVVDGASARMRKLFAPGEITLPSPLFQVDDSSLEVFIGTTGLGAAGALSFSIPKVGEGSVSGRASTKDGLELTGQFTFDQRLFSKASIAVSYRKGAWGITGTIGIGRGKVRGVKSAELTVGYAQNTLTADGNVELDLPGIQAGKLDLMLGAHGFRLAAGFTLGTGLPRIKGGAGEVTVSKPAGAEEYSVAARGTATADIPGIDPTLTIDYANGALTVEVNGKYRFGKLEGDLHFAVTNREIGDDGKPTDKASDRFTAFGSGTARLKLTEAATGEVQLKVYPDGRLTLAGGLSLARNLPLLKKPYTIGPKSLGSLPSGSITIWGASVFGKKLGIFLTYGGGVSFYLSVGPPVLETAQLDLAEIEPGQLDQVALTGKAKLNLPALAYLKAELRLGLEGNLVILKVGGMLIPYAKLQLEGNVGGEVSLAWSAARGLELLDAKGHLSGSAAVIFGLDAEVYAKLDLLLKTITVYRDRFNLAQKKLGISFDLGVDFPVKLQGGTFKPFGLGEATIKDPISGKDPQDLLKTGYDEAQNPPPPPPSKEEALKLVRALPSGPGIFIGKGLFKEVTKLLNRESYYLWLANTYPDMEWGFVRSELHRLDRLDFERFRAELAAMKVERTGMFSAEDLKAMLISDFQEDHPMFSRARLQELRHQVRSGEI